MTQNVKYNKQTSGKLTLSDKFTLCFHPNNYSIAQSNFQLHFNGIRRFLFPLAKRHLYQHIGAILLHVLSYQDGLAFSNPFAFCHRYFRNTQKACKRTNDAINTVSHNLSITKFEIKYFDGLKTLSYLHLHMRLNMKKYAKTNNTENIHTNALMSKAVLSPTTNLQMSIYRKKATFQKQLNKYV